MHILIVDDEALARSRLRSLLMDLGPELGPHHVVEAAHASQALALLLAPGPRAFDLVLLDIHMPDQDGMALAQSLNALESPPAVVFVTAHARHAVQAFELDAVDYLTKPVRRERLRQALDKVHRALARPGGTPSGQETAPVLLFHERGRSMRLPLSEVLYLKAEQKYVTVRTLARSHILNTSLAELESLYGHWLLRIHRNALVARAALRSLEPYDDLDEGEGWGLRLHGLPELLNVSRRQLGLVRNTMRQLSLTDPAAPASKSRK